ncbi:MAG: hypothetical protein ACK5MD_06585 [Flavobacteriales bacterium]
MKILQFILFNLLFSCQNNSVLYLQDNVSIKLTTLNSNKIKFVLNAKEYGFIDYSNTAELVLIEDLDGKMIIPEGTNRINYNNPKDIIGIKCDSTYSFSNDILSIFIALENINHKRMDFQLENNGKKKISIGKTLIKKASH